jgi:hypothetical protein
MDSAINDCGKFPSPLPRARLTNQPVGLGAQYTLTYASQGLPGVHLTICSYAGVSLIGQAVQSRVDMTDHLFHDDPMASIR